jgi:adenylate cyclase
LSWIAFGWPDGSFFAAHKLGDERLEMMEISMVDGALKRRIDRYLVVVGDIEFEERSFEPTTYKVAEQDWFRSALAADGPRWFDVSVHPNGTHPAIAFAGPIDVYQKREGVLAVVIERARLSRFLSELTLGQTGAAFILGPDGAVIAVPDAEADELHMERAAAQKLLPIAVRAAAHDARPDRTADARAGHEMREVVAGDAYAVTLTPLAFPGWTLSTVIPEREFLGPVEKTTHRLIAGLLGLVVLAGCCLRGSRAGSLRRRSSRSPRSCATSSDSISTRCAVIRPASSKSTTCPAPSPTWRTASRPSASISPRTSSSS